MLLQGTQADCGAASLHNALCSLGMHRSLDELRSLCGTTATDGSSERKMLKAARAIAGLEPEVLMETEKRASAALAILRTRLLRGRPVLLLVDPNDDGEAEHWVAAVGLLGPRFLVADSALTELVVAYTEPQLLERWTCSGRDAHYGMVI